MFPRHLWKRSEKKTKHVDTLANSIWPLPFHVVNVPSNTHNNPRPPVDLYRTDLSTSSFADQDVDYE